MGAAPSGRDVKPTPLRGSDTSPHKHVGSACLFPRPADEIGHGEPSRPKSQVSVLILDYGGSFCLGLSYSPKNT